MSETWAGHTRCADCGNLVCSCDYDHEAVLDRQARAYVLCMNSVGRHPVHPKVHADGKEWARSGRDLTEAMKRTGLTD